MLHRIARAVGWQGGARGPQDSQPLVSAGFGAESESTHRQWTEQEARPRAPRVRILVPTEPPITEPEDDEFDEESAGAAGGRGDVRMHEHVGGDAAAHAGFARDHGVLATVPEEDEEELDGGHEDGMHEEPVGDAAAPTGFCRDHRGKLQSAWELCEDVAGQGHEAEDGEDEADHVLHAGAETVPVPVRPQARWRPLSETPWPADRQVSGELELRGSARRRRPSDRQVQATCTIQHGAMTFRSAMSPGAEMVVLAQVPVSDVVATIVPDQTRKFSICIPEDIDSTQVWCCARNQVKRDEWLAVLHRLGVDLYREDDDGEMRLVRQGVQAQPGRTDLSLPG